MTSDFIQDEKASKQSRFLGFRVKSKDAEKAVARPMELTRNNMFVDGNQDMFDVLAQHSMGDHVGIGPKTANLLKKAKNTIDIAEHKIRKQALRIAELERLKTTDELTGLQNRAGFEVVFKRELARTKRYRDHAGILVLIDIESYDSIKRKHDKSAANASLKLVSKILSDEIRDMDVAARLSENEFVLLFTNTAADKVVARVQKLALRINNLSFIWQKKEIHINASLGLQGYGPHDSFEAIFKSDTLNSKKDTKRNT